MDTQCPYIKMLFGLSKEIWTPAARNSVHIQVNSVYAGPDWQFCPGGLNRTVNTSYIRPCLYAVINDTHINRAMRNYNRKDL